MRDSALKTGPGECEADDGGASVGFREAGSDGAVKMTQDINDCTRRRPKVIAKKGAMIWRGGKMPK